MANVLESPSHVGTGASRPRWWVEVLTIAVFYGVYSLIRDLHGTNTANLVAATRNAYRIIRFERYLHVFVEADVQHAFIHDRILISGLDDFYGSAHFLAVAGVLIWLFFARPDSYRRWRNILAVCTALALVGFAFFPVLPPRLLPYNQFHIVDTLKVIGGLWNFSSGPANDVSDQYAAMPSLHTAWSTWSALAVASACKTKRTKIALFVYPALTIFCIVVTGNHYFSDAAAGLVVLGVSYLLVTWLTNTWRRPRRSEGADARRRERQLSSGAANTAGPTT